MKPREATIKRLEKDGWYLSRHGGNHDIYWHDKAKRPIPIKRHDFDEDDARYILKEAKKALRDAGE